MKFRPFFIVILSLVLSSGVSSAKDYKILVLPGGGATAIISAALLEHIEAQTGKSTHELFDEIWGSSAGSIIASLIAKPEPLSAFDVVRFLENNFAHYNTAYFIRETVKKIIGTTLIKNTRIPIRILTATQNAKREWKPFDFSSDGIGQCTDNEISLADIVAASCTVYPYLFRSPINIIVNKIYKIKCIDSGSLCCNPSINDPSAYFLQQLLPHLNNDDTLTLYFVANAFTQSIHYTALRKVLEQQTTHSYAIHYHDDGTYNPEQRAQIEIINIPVNTQCSTIFNSYKHNANLLTKISLGLHKIMLKRIVGKENAVPCLLAAGTVPLAEMKKEAHSIINNSYNFTMMLETLKYNG